MKQPCQNEDVLARCFADIANIGVDYWSPHSDKAATPPVDGDTQERQPNFGTQDDAFNAENTENQDEENVTNKQAHLFL